jgi:hypothetical protein
LLNSLIDLPDTARGRRVDLSKTLKRYRWWMGRFAEILRLNVQNCFINADSSANITAFAAFSDPPSDTG